MANDPMYDKYAYVTRKDIIDADKSIGSEVGNTLIAVRAPFGTKI